MQPYEKIHDYARAVCGQIKWKKAHPAVTEEIENHLVDQRNTYMAEGAEEAAATDQAVVQMGDPVVVGIQLNRTHRPKPPWVMLGLMLALVCVGVFIQMLLEFRVTHYYDIWSFKPLFTALAGLTVMTAFCLIDFSWIGRCPKLIYFTVLVLLFGFFLREMEIAGGNIFYSAYWPLLLPLGFAGIVYSAHGKGYRGLILCEAALLLPAVMMLLIRHRWDFIFFAVSALVILCTAISIGWFKVNIRKGYLLVLIPVVIGIVLAALYIFQCSYRWEKLKAAFNPSLDPLGEGYLGVQVKTLLANSKLFGQGTIPATALDLDPLRGYDISLIFTYLVFDFGWIPVLMLLGVVGFFIVKGFMLCFKQKNGLALFLSLSIMLTFTIPVIGYVLVNMGIMLYAPNSLFILNCDTSYLVNSALVGFMLAIFRTGHVLSDRDKKPASGYRLFNWSGGNT